jgi:hypothetical protein
LPAAIRECEAPPDSPLGIPGRTIACEVEQADRLFGDGQWLHHRKALNSALEHYRKAQQAWEANRSAVEPLDRKDKARYLELEQKITKGINACNHWLATFDQDPMKAMLSIEGAGTPSQPK